MRNRLIWIFSLALSCASWAEPVRIDSTRQDITYQARGQDIEISGHHGNVWIHGPAHKVTVDGHHINVVITQAAEVAVPGDHLNLELADVSSLTLLGHHNDVVVTSGQPVVHDLGGYNSVLSSQGVALPSQPDSIPGPGGSELVLAGARRDERVEADGRDVVIEGSNNRFILLGRPASVTVTGAFNQVELEETRAIVINGLSNSVTYRSGTPRVQDTGMDNVVVHP